MKNLLRICLCGLGCLAYPVRAYVISGLVTDLRSGAPLNAVNVSAGPGINASTGIDGRFSLAYEATHIPRTSFPAAPGAASGFERYTFWNAGGSRIPASRLGVHTENNPFLSGRPAIGVLFSSDAQKAREYIPGVLPKSSASQAAITLTFAKSGYRSTQKSADGSVSGMSVQLDTVPVDTTMGYHDFLYAGQQQRSSFTDQMMYIVRKGKIDWSFSTKKYGWYGEYGDATLLSNGNIAFSRQQGASIIDKDGKLIWDYPGPAGTEIHTCQAIGLNHVGIMQNGSPAKWMLINTLTGKIEKTLVIPTKTTATHGQFRIVRLTEKGTLLTAHHDMAKVSEYDTATGKEIWSAPTKGNPWMAIRLKNGNTLVAVDHQVQELNKAGATVWEVTQKDLPFKISFTQTVQRLANGNTLISSWVMDDPAAEWKHSVQVFEVTPEKRVVWAMKQFDVLGPSTTFQLLDEPGVPESFDMQR